MTRTTIDLDPEVLRQLREASQRTGRPMGALASEALTRALKDVPQHTRRCCSPGTPAGAPTVDLEDREAVRAILDAR